MRSLLAQAQSLKKTALEQSEWTEQEERELQERLLGIFDTCILRAERALKAGNYEESLMCAEAAQQILPGNPTARQLREKVQAAMPPGGKGAQARSGRLADPTSGPMLVSDFQTPPKPVRGAAAARRRQRRRRKQKQILLGAGIALALLFLFLALLLTKNPKDNAGRLGGNSTGTGTGDQPGDSGDGGTGDEHGTDKDSSSAAHAEGHQQSKEAGDPNASPQSKGAVGKKSQERRRKGAESMYAVAKASFDLQEYDEAIAKLKEFTEKHPDSERLPEVEKMLKEAASELEKRKAKKKDDEKSRKEEKKVTGRQGSGKAMEESSQDADDSEESPASQLAGMQGMIALKPNTHGTIAKGHGSRYGGARAAALKRGGGGKMTEKAVLEAIKWLARHQSPDGRWDADGFQDQCQKGKCDGQGSEEYDVGITGLALLAITGAGNTDIYGDFQENVSRALAYLARVQDGDGLLGGGNMYEHAIATFALCEILALDNHLALSRDPKIRSKLKIKDPLNDEAFMNQMSKLEEMARRALYYLEDARNPDMAWRYGYRSPTSDTSVTGWAGLAIFSAINANLAVREETIDGIKRWLDSVTDPRSHAVGYTSPFDTRDTMTAVGLACRLYFGASSHDPHVVGGRKILLKHLPRGDDDGDYRIYYWYYGTLVMFQIGGREWSKWNTALKKCLLSAQEKKGCARGSWPLAGNDHDCAVGGRVYSTAMCALCLEIYYRYPRRGK